MSNGNVEQPTAQTPRGHNSPNGVEVSEEGRQGAPASNTQGQERSNGQSREAREEQLAATRAGLAARARAAGATSTAQPPGPAARPQPASAAGSPSTPPIRQRNEPAQQTPQIQAPPPPTQQRQGASPPTQPRPQPPPAQRPQQPKQVQSPPAQPAPQPQTGGQAPNTSAQAELPNPPSPPSAPPSARPAQGAVPVWDPPPPPAPKQGFLTRLGFGRKAERPEGGQAAAPVQQPRVTPTQPPPTTPGGANTPTATTGPVAPSAQQAGKPTQPRRRPELSLGRNLRHSMAPQPAPALPRLQVWQPQRPLRFVVRSRQAGQPGTTQVRGPQPPGRTAWHYSGSWSAAAGRTAWYYSGSWSAAASRTAWHHTRDPSARTSPGAVRLPRADRLLHRSPRLDHHKPACPPHRRLLQRGRQDRRCSPRLRVQSRHQARRRTLQETSGSVQVCQSTRLKPTIWRSPRWD